MKIVFISQNVSPILHFRRELIEYLVEKGHIVYAFAIDYDSKTKAAVNELGAIPVEYSLNKSGMNPFKDLKDTWLLSRQLKLIDPNVVFSFFIKPSIYGTLAAALAGVSRRIAMLEGLGYIHTLTSEGFSFKKRSLQKIHGLLCTVGYSFADKVLFLNPDDPIDISKHALINKTKINVIGGIGLNLNNYPFRKITASKPIRFIFIARLLAEKGVFEFLEAARILKKQNVDSEFIVLGGLDPDNPAALTKKQLDAVIDEQLIIYPGHVNNVQAWLSGSHVFVLPSYREGVPRSTQEAMAIGLPIITTDVPGCRETVINGENGFIVPAFSAESLAEKMCYFIDNPNEIARMGQESHNLAANKFDVNQINPILEKIIIG